MSHDAAGSPRQRRPAGDRRAQHEAADAIGVPVCELLRDYATEGIAGHVGALVAQVEQLGNQPGKAAHPCRNDPRGRLPGARQVEGDGRLRLKLAPERLPHLECRAEAADGQQRGISPPSGSERLTRSSVRPSRMNSVISGPESKSIISAALAPLPPSRSRMSRVPSGHSYTHLSEPGG
jgi:hypothetical protein